MENKKLWDEEEILITELKQQESKTTLFDSELPIKLWIYKIKNLSQEQSSEIITREDFISFLDEQDVETQAIIRLELIAEINCKNISQDISQNPITPSSLGTLEKNTSISILTNWNYPDDKQLYVASKKPLIANEENGFIENQDIFYINFGNVSDDELGNISGWTLNLESLNSYTLTSKNSLIVLKFTFQQYAPVDVREIEITFEIAPLINASEGFVLLDNDQNKILINDFESNPNLYMYKIRTQLSGTNDYLIEADWLTEYIFKRKMFDYFLDKNGWVRTVNLYAPDGITRYQYTQPYFNEQQNLKDKTLSVPVISDSNGIIQKTKSVILNENENVTGETILLSWGWSPAGTVNEVFPMSGFIPNTKYIIFFNPTNRLNNNPFKDFSEDFQKMNQEFYIADNLGLIGLNENEKETRNSSASEPWKLKNSFFINEFLKMTETASPKRTEFLILSEPKLNPKYSNWENLKPFILQGLQTPFEFDSVFIDQSFPDEATETASDPDPRKWLKTTSEDRKFFIFAPLNLENFLKMVSIPTSNFKQIYLLADNQDFKFDLLTNNSFFVGSKLNVDLLRNKKTAEAKGWPVDFKLTLKTLESILFSATISYTEGGTTLKIENFTYDESGNKTPCLGINEKGEYVKIPPLIIPSLGNSKYGNKKQLRQKIFFGI